MMNEAQAREHMRLFEERMRRLREEILDGTPPPAELIVLAEQVIASQPKEPQTPEQIEAWARQLAADMIAADCPTCGAAREFVDCGHGSAGQGRGKEP